MTENLKIFQASAGSGKTRTLVKEYLAIALSNPSAYKSTLAITFTNKATEEMKSRVVDYLIALSKGGEKQLASELKDELNRKGRKVSEKDIESLSSEVLKNILHDYSNFHISTIDSFCIKVLRSFAKELGLPVGFNIELDTEKVLEDISAKLMDRIGSDEELTKYFDDYILYRLSENGSWNVSKDINEIGMQIFSEEYWRKKIESEEDVYGDRNKTASLIKEILKVEYAFENHLKSKAEELKSLILANNLTHEDFAYKSRGGAFSFILKITDNNEFEPSQTIRNIITKEGDFLKTKSACAPVVNKGVRDMVDFYDKNLAGYNSANAVVKTIYSIGIFSDLLALLDDFRRENRVMVSADINNLLRTLISDDLSPFIYEKIGTRIRNIMIDEFQDTSRFQWNNLKPLVINALSERNSALIVGDVKQSIYRWRNGDMRLLLEGVEKDLSGFRDVLSRKTLSTNYRSHKNIVDFNNNFFSDLISDFAHDEDEVYNNFLTESYEPGSLKQNNNGRKNEGYVRVKMFPYSKENETGTNEMSEQYIKEILKELKDEGYRPSDILVLVRTGDESISISGLISSEKYNVVSERSLLLNNSPAVRMLVFLLKYISDHKDKLSQTGALYNNSLIKMGNDEAVKILSYDSGETEKMFSAIMPDSFFGAGKKHINSVLNELVIYDLAEHLINIFGLDKNADPYIVKFLDTVFKYSKENDADVISFLDYWDKNAEKLSIDVPENADGIRVMTIHKAKGLQSRVVIVPYANWELDVNGNRSRMWASSDKSPFNKASGFFVKTQKELAESYFADDYITESALTRLDNVNLLYVAFTRPTERLYVNVPVKMKKGIANKIVGVISRSPALLENYKDDCFEYGIKKKADELTESKDEGLPVTELNEIVTELWYRKTVIKPAYKKLKTEQKHIVKINRGVLIHELLSRLGNASDVERCIQSAHLNGIISSPETDEYKSILENIVNDEAVKEWFGGAGVVMAETEVLTKDGKILRPDRVVVNGNDAVIIDYKTGKERKEDEEQLGEYESVLKEMGYGNIRKFLLYIGDYDGKVMKVREV